MERRGCVNGINTGRRTGANVGLARGEYTAEGFVVLKGSKRHAQIAMAVEHHSFAKPRMIGRNASRRAGRRRAR